MHRSAGTKFTLKEKTVVRVGGFEHASLQFRITVSQGRRKISSTQSEKLPGTDAEAVSSVFLVLDEGDYSMRLVFASGNSHILRQPCQSVQL